MTKVAKNYEKGGITNQACENGILAKLFIDEKNRNQELVLVSIEGPAE